MGERLSAAAWAESARARVCNAAAHLVIMLQDKSVTEAELLHIPDQLETAAGHIADALVEIRSPNDDQPTGATPAGQPNPIASTVTAADASIARPDGDLRPGQSNTDRLRSMA